MKIIEEVKNPSFLLCIGSDKSDEGMFLALERLQVRVVQLRLGVGVSLLVLCLSILPRASASRFSLRVREATNINPLSASSLAHRVSVLSPHFFLFRCALVRVSQAEYVDRANVALYTCTVGKKPSEAKHFVHSVEDVHACLLALQRSDAKVRFCEFICFCFCFISPTCCLPRHTHLSHTRPWIPRSLAPIHTTESRK